MKTRQWVKQAEKNGWRVEQINGSRLQLRCCKSGCEGQHTADLDALGDPPPPCDLPHAKGCSRKTFDAYECIVGEMRTKRRRLGLSQEDVNAAMGAADGYVNKLESLARVATFPTLQLWAQTLGLSITTSPAPLPPATIRTIENRKDRPYQPNQARFKHDR